ncbi:unnamed protein product, partial [Scytosiphon promiscuus]
RVYSTSTHQAKAKRSVRRLISTYGIEGETRRGYGERERGDDVRGRVSDRLDTNGSSRWSSGGQVRGTSLRVDHTAGIGSGGKSAPDTEEERKGKKEGTKKTMVPPCPRDGHHGCDATDAGPGSTCVNAPTRRRRRCFSCADVQHQQAAPAPPPSSAAAAPAAVADSGATAASTPTASQSWLLPPAPASAAVLSAPGLCPSSAATRAPAAAAAAAPTRRRTGTLTYRVSAAVTAAMLAAAAAAAPLGVGAMTESQCESATLLGTEAALMESPRPDNSTEAAAAGIDQTIVATQATYDRMVLDQSAILIEDGRDVPFKNAWSDHTWFGEAEVTFPGAAALAEFEVGDHPEFQCMNDYYGLSFVMGDAGETSAAGTLSTDRVLNWDLLKPLYEDLEDLDSLVPRDVTSVPSTTFLVAAREEAMSEELTPDFHYFLSEPAADMDSSACPDPCLEQVVTYYWSSSAGGVYRLDTADVSAEPRPCWLDLFDAVADGPPSGGVDTAVWDSTLQCTVGLLEEVEDAVNNGEASAAVSESSGGGGGDGGSGDATVVAAAAVLVPAALLSFAIVAFGLLHHQKGRRLKKMKTTEEAWGEGLDGSGGDVKMEKAPPGPRPPTGRFKLGESGAAVAAEGDDVESGITRLKSFPPPRRVFTDVSIDELDTG